MILTVLWASLKHLKCVSVDLKKQCSFGVWPATFFPEVSLSSRLGPSSYFLNPCQRARSAPPALKNVPSNNLPVEQDRRVDQDHRQDGQQQLEQQRGSAAAAATETAPEGAKQEAHRAEWPRARNTHEEQFLRRKIVVTAASHKRRLRRLQPFTGCASDFVPMPVKIKGWWHIWKVRKVKKCRITSHFHIWNRHNHKDSNKHYYRGRLTLLIRGRST